MKCYLLVYANSLGTRDEIKTALNTVTGITHWRFDMPNSFYILSENTPEELGRALRAARGNRGRFLISELNRERAYGWLPAETWELIKTRSKPTAR